jgi:hypothetical protein
VAPRPAINEDFLRSGGLLPWRRVARYRKPSARRDKRNDAGRCQIEPALIHPRAEIVAVVEEVAESTEYDSDEYVPEESDEDEEEQPEQEGAKGTHKCGACGKVGHHRGTCTLIDTDILRATLEREEQRYSWAKRE